MSVAQFSTFLLSVVVQNNTFECLKNNLFDFFCLCFNNCRWSILDCYVEEGAMKSNAFLSFCLKENRVFGHFQSLKPSFYVKLEPHMKTVRFMCHFKGEK